MALARIGISGWTYAPWRGVFYPPKLPHRLELQYASERLDSIEINGSFYSLQRPSSYRTLGGAHRRRVRVRGEGRPVHHAHPAPEERRGRRSPTSSPPACSPSGRSSARCSGSYRRRCSSTRNRWTRSSACCPAPRPRPAALAGESTLDEDRTHTRRRRRPAAAARGRGAARDLRRPAFTELARAHGVAIVLADTAGRYPVIREPTRRLRVCAPARRRGAVHERLHRRVARPLGGGAPRLARARDGRLRLLRQRREGPRARTTRWDCATGSPGGRRALTRLGDVEGDSAVVSSRVWTIPNVLSFFRLALVPVFLVARDHRRGRLALLVLVVLQHHRLPRRLARPPPQPGVPARPAARSGRRPALHLRRADRPRLARGHPVVAGRRDRGPGCDARGPRRHPREPRLRPAARAPPRAKSPLSACSGRSRS